MESPFLQIAKSNVLSFLGVLQNVAEKFLGKCVQDIKAVGSLLEDFNFRTKLCLFNFHIIPAGKPFQCFHIRKFLMFHEKADGIATSSAAKTFINFLRW